MKTTLAKLLPLFILLTSCSAYRDLERSLVEEDQAPKRKFVTQAQYDQLLIKYEELSKKYESLKDNKQSNSSSLSQEMAESKTKNFSSTNSETVDLFQEAVKEKPKTPVVDNRLSSQILQYKTAVAMMEMKPAEALKIFQELDQKAAPVVRVRAKFQIGMMFYNKGQFDLALQVFDEVINKKAYSGVVIEALRMAEKCATQLSLKTKKSQYSSMLNDVFEAEEKEI